MSLVCWVLLGAVALRAVWGFGRTLARSLPPTVHSQSGFPVVGFLVWIAPIYLAALATGVLLVWAAWVGWFLSVPGWALSLAVVISAIGLFFVGVLIPSLIAPYLLWLRLGLFASAAACAGRREWTPAMTMLAAAVVCHFAHEGISGLRDELRRHRLETSQRSDTRS